MSCKGRFTIYVNVDAARRNDITGIELKSILTYSHVITPAEQRVMYIVNLPLDNFLYIKDLKL